MCRNSTASDDIANEGCSYGMILAKEKNVEEALSWFLRSVHLFPMNWGCWLEMTSAITRVEMVSNVLWIQKAEL